jgi:hypothetical protein
MQEIICWINDNLKEDANEYTLDGPGILLFGKLPCE